MHTLIKSLAQFNYFWAAVLWLPLAAVAQVQGQLRNRSVLIPLLLSLCAGLYSAKLSLFNPGAMRLDMVVLLPLLAIVGAICGLDLVRDELKTLGRLCLSVSILTIPVILGTAYEASVSTSEIQNKNRRQFEAAFSNQQAEYNYFGKIDSSSHPWSAYYYCDNMQDDRYRHLIINDQGKFWLYGDWLSPTIGNATTAPANPQAFIGSTDPRMGSITEIALTRSSPGEVVARISVGKPAHITTATFRIKQPPRFPKAAADMPR
ncbi:hypothetical protein [Chitinimonas sp.]|uniref:hypothetical protein n=1 Tax=Chitinimonas sp. TaxID=1934313 RepID=UPI0035B4E59B